MRTSLQHQWFGIQFNSFCKMDDSKIAGDEFYQKFYKEFYKKFLSYDDLPSSYRKDKYLVSMYIQELIEDKKNILSIGCGNGIIEDNLSKNLRKDQKLIAMEPSSFNSQWLKSNERIHLINGHFPSALNIKEKIDFAYVNTVEYAFNDEEYLNFLKSIYDYGIEEVLLGSLIIVKDEKMKFSLKNYFRKKLFKIGFYEKKQLWGYFRTLDEHLNIIMEAGFTKINIEITSLNYYMIRIKK